MKKTVILSALILILSLQLKAQSFYRGNDLSYVNQMEDCGADFKMWGVSKDPYQIYADHGNNLVRLRLWVDPYWQNGLSQPIGVKRQYSDLPDVKKAIERSKAAGMQVLLDFHYSDFWADPGRQVVSHRWREDAFDTDALAQTLYDYTFDVLEELNADSLLPDMVQVGNETNSGMMIYETMDYEYDGVNVISWSWDRQEKLFNAGIKAVRDISDSTDTDIKIALHYAGVGNGLINWYDNVVENGITDFDVIGFSYYYAWHGSSIAGVKANIETLKSKYPNKEVVILETGYPWTTTDHDGNPNIITDFSDAYAPLSPAVQQEYLVDLTRAVKEAGGNGVIFWESAWVSTACRTPWGQGSSHDHVAFFDYENNDFITSGGGQFMQPYIYEDIETVQTVFQVDMTGYSDTNGVYVAIDLDEDGEKELHRMFPETLDRYTFTHYLKPGTSVDYVFVNDSSLSAMEEVPEECAANGGRAAVIGEETTYADYHWSTCDKISESGSKTEVTLTFAVDMSDENASSAYVTGDFTTRGAWDIVAMTNEGNGIFSYSTTVDISTEGGWYFLSRNSWSARESVPQECVGYYNSDRGYFAGEEDQTFAYKFGSCETFEYVPVSNEEDEEVVPSQISLQQNYPNPFNPETIINFELSSSQNVTLTVYNIAGQKVQTLVSGTTPAGLHQVRFNGAGLPSGVYMYQLETNEYTLSRKMMLLK